MSDVPDGSIVCATQKGCSEDQSGPNTYPVLFHRFTLSCFVLEQSGGPSRLTAPESEPDFDECSEDEWIARLQRSAMRDSLVKSLYVIPSSLCNLSCAYCTTHNRTFGFAAEESVEHDIDLLLPRLDPACDIVFYGGEPLLNWPYMERFLGAATNLGLARFVLVTNGTLMRPEIARVLSRYGVRISVSLDGDRGLNLLRRTVEGYEAFEKAMDGIRVLRNEGVPFGMSCTVTECNVRELKSISQYFVEVIGASSIAFNLLRGASSVLLEQTALSLIEAFKYLRERGVFEERIFRTVRALAERRFRIFDCDGVGRQLTLLPGSRIGGCHVLAMESNPNSLPLLSMGPIELPVTHQAERIRRGVPIFRESCSSCDYIGLCGGGCPLDVLSADENGSEPSICAATRRLGAWVLDEVARLGSLSCQENLVSE